MSLQRRRERYIVIYVWKIIQVVAPNDISLALYFNDRLGIKVHVPPHRQNSRLKESMSIIGHRLWYTLPKNTTLMESLQTFKSNVKKFFGQFPDRPPIKGYPSSKNSILDYALNISTSFPTLQEVDSAAG